MLKLWIISSLPLKRYETIFKSLVITKMVYLTMIEPTPELFIDDLHSSIFLRDTSKGKHIILSNEQENCGLKSVFKKGVPVCS